MKTKLEKNAEAARIFLFESNPSGWKILCLILPFLKTLEKWEDGFLHESCRAWHSQNPVVRTKECNDDFGEYRNFPIGFGDVAMALRCAITASTESPPVFLVMETLGKDETIKRINRIVSFHGK